VWTFSSKYYIEILGKQEGEMKAESVYPPARKGKGNEKKKIF
jgi:hypothetical protein